ncbi:chitin disaccharide deacetylase [Vibrio sp. F74]|uniref:chitin disaccharide deacetylase n=1 Tax=Vibrio sp. F74 TaxID=700020 RepID=UPI0035F5A783
MHVIFNADDFGLTSGVNLGIVAASQSGVVSSTTFMVGMKAGNHAIDLAKKNSSLKVGIHLRFTVGAPLTVASCLTDENGQFLLQDELWNKQDINEQQVGDEVIAQIESFLTSGMFLSHIDSHHHIHTHPKILPIIKDIANYYQVPLRGCGVLGTKNNDCRYSFSDQFYGEDISIDKIWDIINSHRSHCDVLEIMCHPAYIDQPLFDASGYSLLRAKELAILTDENLKKQLNEQRIELCDYSILTN